jgi:hypothetical protein
MSEERMGKQREFLRGKKRERQLAVTKEIAMVGPKMVALKESRSVETKGLQ